MYDEDGPYVAIFLENARKFIDKELSVSEKGKVAAQIEIMRKGQFRVVYIKLLKRPIKELIVGKYRFTFFIEKHLIYFIDAFVKKTQKTPKKYIEQSEKIYKTIIKIK